MVGGTLVALVPIVANRYGGNIAGLVLLFPVLTLTGLLFISLRLGPGAVQSATVGSIKALPAVLIFLLGVYVATRLGQSTAVALGVGLAGWLLAVVLLLATKIISQ